jgi:hypothetical protein
MEHPCLIYDEPVCLLLTDPYAFAELLNRDQSSFGFAQLLLDLVEHSGGCFPRCTCHVHDVLRVYYDPFWDNHSKMGQLDFERVSQSCKVA